MAEAHGDVEAFADEIAELLARDEIERYFRIALQEAAGVRGQHPAREERVDVDSQAAANHGGGTRRVREGLCDTGQERTDCAVKAPPFIRQGDRARGAVEESDAHPRLQAGDCATDAGWRET